MATLYASPLLRSQLQQARDAGGAASDCDCRSYSYLALAMMLLAVGSAVSVLSLSDADGRLFNRLGHHAWLVGPIFICSGVMVAVKSMLYLRRKSIIRMMLHRQDLFLNMVAAQAERELSSISSGRITRAGSSSTLPPSYETLAVVQQPDGAEAPPPTYDEAMLLIDDGSKRVGAKIADGMSKESVLTIVECQNFQNSKP